METTNLVQSITDEQIAEIEAGIPCGQTMGHGYSCDKWQPCRQCRFTSALISRLRAAEMDAARYRWVRERGDAFQWENILGFDIDDFVCQDSALDAAIDAALTAAGVAYK